MNKVILMGRLTADPNLNQTPSGVSSCRFTIAINRPFANKQTGERDGIHGLADGAAAPAGSGLAQLYKGFGAIDQGGELKLLGALQIMEQAGFLLNSLLAAFVQCFGPLHHLG